MALQDTIGADLKLAMKNKDIVAKDTLRAIKSEILNKEVELGRPLNEAEEMAVLTSAVKIRRDAIAEYEKAGRADLAENEKAQIAIVERYLPAQLSEDDARSAIRALAGELGITSKKEMGKLMKVVMDRFRGQIEGKTASRLAGEVLS